MDIYCEQNVSNPYIDKHRRQTKAFDIIRKVLLGIGILAFIFYVFFGIGGLPVSSSALTIIINVVFAVMILAPFVLIYIFMGRRMRSVNSEYDYILNSGKLKIVSVVLRTKRKLMTTVPMDCVESVGRLNAEAYERYYSVKSTKKLYAVCNYENEDGIIYIRYRADGEDYLLHLEPNEEMLTALKRSLPRISILDKSLTTVNPVKKQ